MTNNLQLEERIRNSFIESAALEKKLAVEMTAGVATAVSEIVGAFKNRKKIILFGNGGSAADAQHIAAEFIGRFERERNAMPALALACNSSNVTALANDYGFDCIFTRQIEALAESGDVLMGISTSGRSPNVIQALRRGKELGCYRIGLIGRDGGPMKEEVDLPLIVPSTRTCRIQEAHITIGHIICEIVEERLFEGREGA